MSEVLQVEKRDALGSSACRRLRQGGRIPAVVYGHGEESISVSVSTSELMTAIRHGSKLVQIEGAVTDSAMLKEVQWDSLGSEVLHIDLTRVSVDEMVEVELTIELRGVAPGTKEGGVVEIPMHELTIVCPAGAIPEKITVNVNEMHLGDAIHASDVKLPERAKLVTPPDAVVAQCVEVTVEEELETEGELTGAEPEVIGRKAEEDEESGD